MSSLPLTVSGRVSTSACEQNPRHGTRRQHGVECAGAQFYQLEHRLDRADQVQRRATRGTMVTRRPLRTARQAQPVRTRSQQSGDARSEFSALFGFIENVEHAAIEDEVERLEREFVAHEVEH